MCVCLSCCRGDVQLKKDKTSCTLNGRNVLYYIDERNIYTYTDGRFFGLDHRFHTKNQSVFAVNSFHPLHFNRSSVCIGAILSFLELESVFVFASVWKKCPQLVDPRTNQPLARARVPSDLL